MVKITIRADSGFAREPIMGWCEAHGVDYVLGLARNARLERAIGGELQEMREQQAAMGEPARCYRELACRTRKTWSCERRVVAKAEHLAGKANPRFVVTSWSKERADAEALCAKVYRARGDMENRSKEQQLDPFADRTSAADVPITVAGGTAPGSCTPNVTSSSDNLVAKSAVRVSGGAFTAAFAATTVTTFVCK